MLGIDTRVQSGKVEGEWAYVVESPAVPQKAGAQRAKARRVVKPGPYSAPEYYFEVTVGNSRARSGLLGLKSGAELKFLDHEGKPMSNVKYKVRTPSGEIPERDA